MKRRRTMHFNVLKMSQGTSHRRYGVKSIRVVDIDG